MANTFGGEFEEDTWEMWLYGVIVPLPIAGLALLWIISRHADLHDHRNNIVLVGSDAVALGLTALSLALAMHFQYFWRLSVNPVLNQYYVAGKVVSLIGAIIGFLYIIWCFVRLFIL